MENISKNNDLRVMILPKQDKLARAVAPVFEQAGLRYDSAGPRRDYGTLTAGGTGLPATEALVSRPQDALRRVLKGLAELAVVGRDSLEEFRAANPQGSQLKIAARFNHAAPCRLSISGPANAPFAGPASLRGQRIATAYPAILQGWLDAQQIRDVEIVGYDGGIEDCIRLGEADYVFDVVETGGSLRQNGLEEKIRVLDSCAVLVQQRGRRLSPVAQQILGRLTDGTPVQAPSKNLDNQALQPVFAL